jgi:hypothetical protein
LTNCENCNEEYEVVPPEVTRDVVGFMARLKTGSNVVLDCPTGLLRGKCPACGALSEEAMEICER